MVDEVLFMQSRLFRMFCRRTGMSSVAANRMFEKYGIWAFVEECYDSLHLSSDDCALEDIFKLLTNRGVVL